MLLSLRSPSPRPEQRPQCRAGVSLLFGWMLAGMASVTLTAVSPAAELQPGLLAAPAVEELNDISARLQQVLASRPELAGAWVDIDADPDAVEGEPPRFVFHHRTVDARRVQEQIAALERVARELVPSGRYRFDTATDRQLPLSELLDGLRAVIRRDVRFPGCDVLGAGYRINPDDEGSLELVPRFRVARDGQFDELAQECRRLVQASPAWAKVAVYDGDPGQMMIVAEQPEPDINDVFARLRRAVREMPELRGTWLNVEADDQGHPGVAPTIYRFERAFDARRAAAQTDAMERLVQKLVPSGRYRFETDKDRVLPLSDLLDALTRELDIEPRFAGCSVVDASYRFNEDDDSFDLVLHGRVWQERQIEIVAETCRRLMAEQPAWKAADVQLQTAGDDGLVVVPPSPQQAAIYYGQAMHHFWNMNYAEADRLLALASIEDPKNVVYRYWRVIGELARNDQDQAQRRLQKTVDGFRVRPHSRDHAEVMRSIYRIQGPLRYALIDAENKAMMRGTVAGRAWD
jgi:hypothetical protein